MKLEEKLGYNQTVEISKWKQLKFADKLGFDGDQYLDWDVSLYKFAKERNINCLIMRKPIWLDTLVYSVI